LAAIVNDDSSNVPFVDVDSDDHHVCWEQIAEGCMILNMGKNEKVNKHLDGNKCTGFFPLGNPKGAIYRGLVIMSKRPPNHPVHTKGTVMSALQ
jgi:hypothetical protein